ncbi:MAG: DUF4405 domain-containing protein [Oscillospiraceae bacterium]|nr:DUF4405 domain-containing protein [Oscillospiraceae bacterium]
MNKNSAVRYITDAVITVLLIVLMQYQVTGNVSHEIIGIAEFILFIIHNVLNRRWFRGSLERITSSKTTLRIKIWTVIDYVLIFVMILLAVTSVMISHLINLPLQTDISFWAYWHKTAAYASLIIISVHLGLHWKAIISVIYRQLEIDKDNIYVKIIVRTAVLVVSLFGILNLYSRYFKDDEIKDEKKAQTLPESESLRTDNLSLIKSTQTEVQIYKLRGATERVFTESIGDDETSDDFLSRLVCTGCSRRCILTNPRCSTGASQQKQALEYFNSYTESANQQQESDDTSSPEVTKEPESSQQPGKGTQPSSGTPAESNKEEKPDDSQTKLPETQKPQKTEETYDTEIRPSADEENWFDLTAGFGSIMILFIAGTYFTVEITGRKHKKKK